MGLVPDFAAMPDVVLTWAFDGLMRVVDRGSVWVPTVVKNKTNAMWATSDVLGEYWLECGLWLSGGSTIVATAWLYNNVRSWGEQYDAELVERIGSKQQFAELLKTQASRGFESGRSTKALGGMGKQVNAWTVPYTYVGPKNGLEGD
jgi:hypothetical protein